MGEGAASNINEVDRFIVDGVEFVPSWTQTSVPGSLVLLKSAQMVPIYEDLLRPYPQPRMVELGISQGGSVGLLALLTRPTKFVAIDLSDDPIEPLIQLLQERGLSDAVKPYFGVDQADKDRLTEIIADEFGDDALDVVVDDASHLYEQTVASFEVLFPRLRPGGVYVIEDWTWNDIYAHSVGAVLSDPTSPHHQQLLQHVNELAKGEVKQERPISRIALEMVLAQAQSQGVVSSVTVDENWITVRRGDAPLEGAGFRMSDLYADSFALLTP